MDELKAVAYSIISELENEGSREIPTKLLGIKVMDKLHGVDPVAYVRYASVYRQFQDVGEFIDEINSMSRRVPRSTLHPELFY
jgi:transcriptional repressor NrdR